MIYTTITKMTFKLPEEYKWSLEVEKGYKDMGMAVTVYDGSTISRTLKVTESYHMDMPTNFSKEHVNFKEETAC